MARHLVEAGHDVTVASRSRGPIDAAVGFGATDGGGPQRRGRRERGHDPLRAQLAGRRRGPRRRAAGARCRARSSSTRRRSIPRSSARSTTRVTATGARYLEAPLSGGTAGAQKGTLTLMVGGDEATLEAARPALDPFAGLIVHVGGPGMGQVVKLCNNLIYAAQMLATAEATVMAERAGRRPRAALRGADARHRRLRRGAHPAARPKAWSPTARRRTGGRRAS